LVAAGPGLPVFWFFLHHLWNLFCSGHDRRQGVYRTGGHTQLLSLGTENTGISVKDADWFAALREDGALSVTRLSLTDLEGALGRFCIGLQALLGLPRLNERKYTANWQGYSLNTVFSRLVTLNLRS
ncbi:MAG: hypothetical protein QMC81_11510, partial [Thermoanaerobacterales bacterium]|nr:hypothetical protein [Thermoanaerobacterales bacterium]